MGILSSTIFVSIDGVYQAPGGPDEDREGPFEHGGWSAPLSDADVGDWIAAATTLWPDALLLGRKTYDIFAGYWPTAEVGPISRKLNEMPKYVASRSRSSVDWTNSTLVTGDLVDAVSALKDEHDVIGTIGSGDLVRALLRGGVVDELRLLVHPVIIGSGKRFFGLDGTGAPGTWKLASALTFANGSLVTTYRPAGALETGDLT